MQQCYRMFFIFNKDTINSNFFVELCNTAATVAKSTVTQVQLLEMLTYNLAVAQQKSHKANKHTQ